MSSCVVIPVYNHGAAIAAVVEAILQLDVPCMLVDDGSDFECASVLDSLVAMHPDQVVLVRLTENQGKGAAMLAGFREAARQGFSHVLQIDADGQHDTDDIPAFLALSRKHPLSMICGCPIYDDSVPKARLYGRYLTHGLVWLNTLSFALKDSMCGFRVYPLAATLELIDSTPIGRRMDFDIDIAVRLIWAGVPIVNRPTRVTYPKDGISHFRMTRDNLLISRIHGRLFIGMLLRAPRLLARRFSVARAL